MFYESILNDCPIYFNVRSPIIRAIERQEFIVSKARVLYLLTKIDK